MKIEAGKYYRTRGGKKAFVIGKDPLNCTLPSVLFAGFVQDCPHVIDWFETGKRGYNDIQALDLVEEWKEPEVFTLVVGVVRTKNGDEICKVAYAGPQPPNFIEDGKVLTLQVITLIEGEFNGFTEEEAKSKLSQEDSAESGCNISSSARSGNVSSEHHGGFNS